MGNDIRERIRLGIEAAEKERLAKEKKAETIEPQSEGGGKQNSPEKPSE